MKKMTYAVISKGKIPKKQKLPGKNSCREAGERLVKV